MWLPLSSGGVVVWLDSLDDGGPFLLIVCLLMSLVAVGSLDTSRAMTAQATPLASNGHGDRKRCGQPIRVFVIIAPLLLLPYGLVLSGVVQPERAHRLLWWWKHPWLRRLVGGSAACASIWLALGGNWLFAADSTCALVEPRSTRQPLCYGRYYYSQTSQW